MNPRLILIALLVGTLPPQRGRSETSPTRDRVVVIKSVFVPKAMEETTVTTLRAALVKGLTSDGHFEASDTASVVAMSDQDAVLHQQTITDAMTNRATDLLKHDLQAAFTVAPTGTTFELTLNITSFSAQKSLALVQSPVRQVEELRDATFELGRKASKSLKEALTPGMKPAHRSAEGISEDDLPDSVKGFTKEHFTDTRLPASLYVWQLDRVTVDNSHSTKEFGAASVLRVTTHARAVGALNPSNVYGHPTITFDLYLDRDNRILSSKRVAFTK